MVAGDAMRPAHRESSVFSFVPRAMSALASLALAALLTAQDPETWRHDVRIENPDGCTLTLHRVLDDTSLPVEELGAERTVERSLAGDRCYWLAVAHHDRTGRVPLPLPRRARIFAPLTVTVRTPPPAHPREPPATCPQPSVRR